VVVYLGESNTSALAISLVKRLFLINRMSNTGRKRRFLYGIPSDAAHALKTMLACGWFGRVWVVQEIVLARNKITIHYGSETLDWERFSWFTQSIMTDSVFLDMLSKRLGGSGLTEITADSKLELHDIFMLIITHDVTNIDLDYTFTDPTGRPSKNLTPLHRQTSSAFWQILCAGGFANTSVIDPTKWKTLMETYARFCGGRCMAITEKGHVGLFLEDTKEGDFVCVFPGSRLPFNIRKIDNIQIDKGEQFELIGPAYVHGIMDGISLPANTVMDNIQLR